MSADTDWLDLHDNRGSITTITAAPETPAVDINKAFDDIAAMFEIYPQPPEKPSKYKSDRGKSHHLNTRKTKSK